jgi:hypothetical protein
VDDFDVARVSVQSTLLAGLECVVDSLAASRQKAWRWALPLASAGSLEETAAGAPTRELLRLEFPPSYSGNAEACTPSSGAAVPQ